MPAVSALLVFHRDTPFLRPAVASLLTQTWKDLEVVLVDNGTGLPPAALGELGADPRLRWVRLPRNEGIPAGHNAGVAAARGRYITLLDYDDVALPQRVARQVMLLEQRTELGLVSSLAETIDDTGRVCGREFALVEPAAQHAYVQFAAPVVTPAYTGRRELFERYPYRAQFPLAADFDFLARSSEACAMAAVPEVLLQYRRYSAQTTQAKAAEIEYSRGAIRVATAQRRSGRPERLTAAAAPPADLHNPADAALAWARAALSEGFAAVAAFQARRAVALRGNAAVALAVGLRAVMRAPAERRSFALRMLLSGPVKALALAPV